MPGLSSCVKLFDPPEGGREFKTVTTSVSGSLTHKYYHYPIKNTLVKVYSYRSEPDNFAYSIITEDLDSVYTDDNGLFSMTFTHQDNSGAGSTANKYYVHCPYLKIDSAKQVYPGVNNSDVSLYFYVKPVLGITFTVSNLLYPPLQVGIPGGAVKIYNSGDTTLYCEVEANTGFGSSYRYTDLADSIHIGYFDFTVGAYHDTFFKHIFIDASTF